MIQNIGCIIVARLSVHCTMQIHISTAKSIRLFITHISKCCVYLGWKYKFIVKIIFHTDYTSQSDNKFSLHMVFRWNMLILCYIKIMAICLSEQKKRSSILHHMNVTIKQHLCYIICEKEDYTFCRIFIVEMNNEQLPWWWHKTLLQ